jgi:hypothetical protein
MEKKLGMVVTVIPELVGNINGRIVVQAGLGKKRALT